MIEDMRVIVMSMKAISHTNISALRTTPGSTALGPAYTSVLASTGQSLEYLVSADPSAFIDSVKGVRQALQVCF